MPRVHNQLQLAVRLRLLGVLGSLTENLWLCTNVNLWCAWICAVHTRTMDQSNAVILATAGYDHKIHFWEPPTGECVRTLRFSDSQVILCLL